MAKKSFTFVEDSKKDNGYNYFSGVLTWGEVDVKSVKELVDHVDKNVGKKDCIESITIIGHGHPGCISVGAGQGYHSKKAIGVYNENVWGPLLDRLACRFCKGGTVYLRGCNTGADKAGADLLHRIKLRLKCAIVQAPTGVCNPLYTTGDVQESKPKEKKPPKAIPNPDKKSKKKGKKKKVSRVLGGNPKEALAFKASDITGAKFLSAIMDEGVEVWEIQETGYTLDERQVEKLRKGLGKATAEWYPSHGFSMNGYLQLQVNVNDRKQWLPPGIISGNGTYYSAFGEDTSMVLTFPKKARKMLKRMLDNDLCNIEKTALV